MSRFICLLGASAAPDMTPYATRLARESEGEMQSVACGRFAAVALMDPVLRRPLVAHWNGMVGVGDVRLDNRRELLHHAKQRGQDVSDLELVLAAFFERGEDCILGLLGDFAFVIWDSRTDRLLAVRDAFGVKNLVYNRRPEELAFSSRSIYLVRGNLDEINPEFIADFLVGGVSAANTAWKGCHAVPMGSIIEQAGPHWSARHYWDPDRFRPEAARDESEIQERFRDLFAEAVRSRFPDRTGVWSHLSGGVDSSSVVCMAQHLLNRGDISTGIESTVTVVDELGGGDERTYSEAVVQRFGLRNETVMNYWAWQDDGLDPPSTDEPHSHYPLWAAQRKMWATVRDGGGWILLSGQGADHYLSGGLQFIADWLARGRVGPAVRELVRFSVAYRTSFWGMSGREALYPYLPLSLKLRLLRPESAIPSWIEPRFTREFGILDRLPAARRLRIRPGDRFRGEVSENLAYLPHTIERGFFQEGLEMRYPFLHRPLVEFALRLSPESLIRPAANKWVLREAMRGILPEIVRTRKAKGTIGARLLWSLNRENRRINQLLQDPLSVQMGWINPVEFRNAVELARCGETRNLARLLRALSLETWLAVRSGRWTVQEQVLSIPA